MLPLQEVPVDQRKQKKRSTARATKRVKPLDRRVVSALAAPERVLFLDVETTGLSWFYDQLTIVGWAIEDSYCLHIAGDDPELLINSLKTAHTLVTFNGTLRSAISRPTRRIGGRPKGNRAYARLTKADRI